MAMISRRLTTRLKRTGKDSKMHGLQWPIWPSAHRLMPVLQAAAPPRASDRHECKALRHSAGRRRYSK
jgi:hypothetical protein